MLQGLLLLVWCRKLPDHLVDYVQQDVLGLTTILNSGEYEATVSSGQGFKCENTVVATVGGGDVRSLDRHYLGP